MNDLQLAVKYKPYIRFDHAEPFEVKAVGFTIFRQSAPSRSFRRNIDLDRHQGSMAIEYAIYFDYDIQHLYDLEHVWVYVDEKGGIADAEASFHGKYFKAVSPSDNRPMIADGTHIELYSQPGKHAFMPDGKLFRLVPDLELACNECAGEGGLLIAELFKDNIFIQPGQQQAVRDYIKQTYSFHPTLEFEYRPVDDGLLISWDELRESIPSRVNGELSRIVGSPEDDNGRMS